MYPKYHIIASALLSIMLYPFFGLNVLWIFFAGFLIDVDHYIYYVIKFRNLSLKKAYKYYVDYEKKRHIKDALCIFHTIEFFILLIILSFYNTIVLLVSISIFLHEILDIIEIYRIDAWNAKAFSLFLWLKNNI